MQLVQCTAPSPCATRAAALAPRSVRPTLRVHSAQKQSAPLASVDDANVNAYCSLDADGKRLAPLTLGEKEQIFLEALSSYYYDGKPSISDQEFDNLKDELLWSGSKVAVLSSDEKKFLEATAAYNRGKPVMSDADFDALKRRLKQEGSIITAEGPRCSLRTRTMYSDASVDYLRMLGINIPAALLVLGGVFSIDDLTGFEITKLIELPEPYGIVVLWGFLLPTIYVLASSLTNAVFKDALILKAPCPNCGTETTTYFGDILTVSGNRKKNELKCSKCSYELEFDATARAVKCTQPAGK